MTDKTKEIGESKEAEETPEGVVHDRRVVSRPLSWLDRDKRPGGPEEAKAIEAENPSAPKPTARNEYVREMRQMRRRHKTNQRKTPNYMSDVKI